MKIYQFQVKSRHKFTPKQYNLRLNKSTRFSKVNIDQLIEYLAKELQILPWMKLISVIYMCRQLRYSFYVLIPQMWNYSEVSSRLHLLNANRWHNLDTSKQLLLLSKSQCKHKDSHVVGVSCIW